LKNLFHCGFVYYNVKGLLLLQYNALKERDDFRLVSIILFQIHLIAGLTLSRSQKIEERAIAGSVNKIAISNTIDGAVF